MPVKPKLVVLIVVAFLIALVARSSTAVAARSAGLATGAVSALPGPALTPAEGPALSGSSPEASAEGEAEGKGNSSVSMELRDASLRDALDLLFKDTGASYTLAPGVSGKVTLSLNRVTLDQGLHAILQPNDLTYRKDPGDIYYITRSQETTAPEPTSSSGASVPAAQEGEVFFIGPGGIYELQYLDCRDVATWFGGTIAGGAPMLPIPITGVSGAGLGAGGGGAVGASALGAARSGGVVSTPGVPYPGGAGSPVAPAGGTGSGSPSGGRGRSG